MTEQERDEYYDRKIADKQKYSKEPSSQKKTRAGGNNRKKNKRRKKS